MLPRCNWWWRGCTGVQYSVATKVVLYNLLLQPIEGNEGRGDTVHGDESEAEVLIFWSFNFFCGPFSPTDSSQENCWPWAHGFLLHIAEQLKEAASELPPPRTYSKTSLSLLCWVALSGLAALEYPNFCEQLHKNGDFYWFVLPPSLSCYIMLQMESGNKSFCRLANLFPLFCNIWNVLFHCMSNLHVVAVG